MFLHKTRADIILISWTLLMDQILYELGWWTLFSILAFNWLARWMVHQWYSPENEHGIWTSPLWGLEPHLPNFYFWDPGIRSFVGEMQAFWPASGGNEQISTGRFSPNWIVYEGLWSFQLMGEKTPMGENYPIFHTLPFENHGTWRKKSSQDPMK